MDYGNIAEWVGVFANIASLTVAMFILWQAVQIRHNQGVQKHNSSWNQFNEIVLTDDNLDTYNEFFYDGHPQNYDPKYKINWLLFCKLNVLEGIILDLGNDHIKFERAFDILIDQARLLSTRKTYVISLMKDRGYSRDTIEILQSYFQYEKENDFEKSLRSYVAEHTLLKKDRFLSVLKLMRQKSR